MRISKSGLGIVILLSIGAITGLAAVNRSINRSISDSENMGVSISDYVELIPEDEGEKLKADYALEIWKSEDLPEVHNSYPSSDIEESISTEIPALNHHIQVENQVVGNSQGIKNQKKENDGIKIASESYTQSEGYIQSEGSEMSNSEASNYDNVSEGDAFYEKNSGNEIAYKDPTGDKADVLKDSKAENEEQMEYTEEQLKKMQNNNTRVGAGGILKDTIIPAGSVLRKSTTNDAQEDGKETDENEKKADSYDASEGKSFDTTEIGVD